MTYDNIRIEQEADKVFLNNPDLTALCIFDIVDGDTVVVPDLCIQGDVVEDEAKLHAEMAKLVQAYEESL